MHVKRFLHKILLPVTHKKRMTTFILLVETVLKNKRLSLTELGRSLELPIQERSGIRRVDRFLGNSHLYQEREKIYERVIRHLIGSRIRPDILVDWSPIPNTTHHVLRAALVASGRALTLYEEVHPEKKLGNKKVQNQFLKKLNTLLPENCRPIIITDAGFHNDWFKQVVALDWDYLGRIRGKKYLRFTGEWELCANWLKKGSQTPHYLGLGTLCQSNPLESRFCLFKGKPKGRKSLTRSGKRRQDKSSLDYRKSAKEAWLLATSLPESHCLAKKVIKKYSYRMQIEEGFRDLKSSRYGFGFEKAYSKGIHRIAVLLLIAALASWIAWLTGWIAEKNNLHYSFQSNTIRNRRVLSLFFLGCQLIKRKVKIPIKTIMDTLNEDLCYAV